MNPTLFLRRLAKEFYTRLRVARALRGVATRSPILVYQMGKVGSSTVAKTLQELTDRPVIQVHVLNPQSITEGIHTIRASRSPFLPEHLLYSQVLSKQLARRRFSCIIITLTREPIARAISFAFEDRHRKLPNLPSLDTQASVAYASSCIRKMLSLTSPHGDPSLWFDRELYSVFGINVFDHPYDFDFGYTWIDHPKHPVLVIRLEDFTRSLKSAIGRVLDLPEDSIALRTSNVGSTKQYAELLRNVKNSFKLPLEELDQIYGTRYAKHFYVHDLPSLRTKWGQC